MFWFLRGSSDQTPNPRRKKPSQSAVSTAGSSRTARVATEVLNFQDQEVSIHRRPYKRSIGLTLQVNGRIKVSAPKSIPLSHIHDFLHKHSKWIESNLQKYQALRDAYPPKSYFEGEEFLFLGQHVRLSFEKSARAKVEFRCEAGKLICGIPELVWQKFDPSQPHPELGEVLAQFYSTQGRHVLTERLKLYSERMGLKPSAISFRAQKTRWGSCSSKGKISLNWRLIVAPIEIIDYVVVHELSHLRHYNHSKAFWALVESQIPRCMERRQWLRDHQYEADFLAKRSELYG